MFFRMPVVVIAFIKFMDMKSNGTSLFELKMFDHEFDIKNLLIAKVYEKDIYDLT